MNTVIAFCGLDCSACPAFHAVERLSIEERQRVADQWAADFGAVMTAEQVDCVGCASTASPHVGYCEVCEIRKCALAKAVSTCAACPEYGCDKLAAFLAAAPEAKSNLEALRN